MVVCIMWAIVQKKAEELKKIFLSAKVFWFAATVSRGPSGQS